MNWFSFLVFGLSVNCCLTLVASEWWKRRKPAKSDGKEEFSFLVNVQEDETKKRWCSLLSKYLAVYLLAFFSDLLQGPYIYALYEDYGFSQQNVAVLFVARICSSMVFGSCIGSMADTGGRRSFVVLFSIFSAVTCLTKHFNIYGILFIGQLSSGIAASLLHTVFEAWLIGSHTDQDLKQYVAKSLSWAQYGSSLVVIVAGLLANRVAEIHEMVSLFSLLPSFNIGGYIGPFDVAFCASIFSGIIAALIWEENNSIPGSKPENSEALGVAKWYKGLKNAYNTSLGSPDICLCCGISSLFEGSLYNFFFALVPALSLRRSDILPYDIIFSTLMISCMIGCCIFCLQRKKVEELSMYVLPLSAASMAAIAISNNLFIRFLAMNVFQVMVGMYFPIMGTMKSSIVPESQRAAIYSLFRIPLNFLVLLNVLIDLTVEQSFTLNFFFMSVAFGLQSKLLKNISKQSNGITQD